MSSDTDNDADDDAT